MNGRACLLVRTSSAVRVSTVPVRRLGMVVYFLCGAVRPRTAYRGVMCEQSLYWNLCAIFYVGVRAVRRSEWAAQAVYIVSVCVYVCMYGGQHVQPERCTYRREYVYTRVYGVRHLQIELCTCRAEVHVCVFAQCSACAI